MSFVTGIAVDQSDWDKLDDLQKQFIREAEDGSFRYLAENGRVIAWGAQRTGNLFSMEVIESEGAPGEGVYVLAGDKYQ